MIAWLLSRTSSMTVIQRRRYWIVVLIVKPYMQLKNPSGAGDLVVTRQQDAAQSAAAKRVARRSAGIAFDFTQRHSMHRAVLFVAARSLLAASGATSHVELKLLQLGVIADDVLL